MGNHYGRRLDNAAARVLLDAMDERGLSLRDVSERTGIPRRTLQGILHEHRQIKLWHLCAIADALDADCGDLVRLARALADGRT